MNGDDDEDAEALEWALGERIGEADSLAHRLTVAVNERRAKVDRSALDGWLEQLDELRLAFERLAYAVDGAAAVAELDSQIARHAADERLAMERARVASKSKPAG